MPDLASCYFCGTIADSVIERPIADTPNAPPELDRTILLCQGCGEKLDTILAPVFEQQSTKNRKSHTTDTNTDPTIESTGESTDENANDGMTWPEPTPRNRQQRNETSTTNSTQQNDRANPDEHTTDPLSESTTAANDREQSSDDKGSKKSTKPSAEELPDGTRQVLRLLRNREFPINRAEIEEVTRSAYDFDRGECGLVIDALIDQGILRETDGQLHPND